MKKQPIVIIGGGFAGLRAALDLDKAYGHSLHTPIFLVDPSPYHIYTPSLYEVASSSQPRVAVIPFRQILAGTNITHIQERVRSIDCDMQHVITEHRRLAYADVVLALGSQPAGIHGNKTKQELSFAYKTLDDVLAIRQHINHCFTKAKQIKNDHCHNHFIVVGGGPAGVEFASGLQHYIRSEAQKHGLSGGGAHISLVEAGSRLVPFLPPVFSKKIAAYLQKQGITVRLHSPLTPKGHKQLLQDDERAPLKTVFSTTGIQAHELIQTLKGVRHDAKGRVLVDAGLHAIGMVEGLWAAGDSASVKDSGLAWSAIAHGRHVAKAIQAKRRNQSVPAYFPSRFPVVLPLSATYGVALLPDGTRLEGRSVIWYKRWMDFKYYASILPLFQAIGMWLSHGRVVEENGQHRYQPHFAAED